MQDIDDFDPLDDILLSDEELPETRTEAKYSHTFISKSKELDTEEELKKEKKKKIIAELFGSNEEPIKIEETSVSNTGVLNKSDWLELKTEEPSASLLNGSQTTETKTSKTEVKVNKYDGIKEKSVQFSSSFSVSDRRKSEGKPHELQKSKHCFKSLDMDLLHFNSINSSEHEKNLHTNSETEFYKKVNDDEDVPNDVKSFPDNIDEKSSVYTPSSGVSRRIGISKPRNIQSEQNDWLSFIAPQTSHKVPLDYAKVSDARDTSESLPSWLEQKKYDNVESSAESAVNSNATKTKSAEIHYKNESSTSKYLSSTKIEATKQASDGMHISENVAEDMNDEFKENRGKYVVSDIHELKRKRDELMERLRTETESLTQQEQEIYSSAVELMLQQRDNVKTLFQIISFDDLCENKRFSNTTESDIRSRVKHFEDTIVQLQKKLAQEQLEKVELEMRLKHMEHKHKIDLTMLEDVYKYKLHLAEEKDAHNKQAIQFLESDYNMKLSKRKENEEELIQMYNDKIQLLKEEHMKELKHAAEMHNLKSSWRSVVFETKDSESLSDRELTLREIAVEEKHKQLLELEERLNKQKLALDGKESSLDAKIEEFDVRTMKEKLHLDQQKKELKLSQNILNEKQTYWQRELHREKEHLLQSKTELEALKDELLNEERKLTKQKFELCSERARLEAIINADGNRGGCVKDIIQSRAELQGTVDELQQLKSKLEKERNEVKKEELRLKEEGWKLRMVEQQLTLQRRQFEKAIQESERKRDEGIEALARAQKIESQMNERAKEVERQLLEVKRKEELLVQEKIELSREHELLAKKRSQLDMILPQLTLEEQLPFSLLSKNILDPRVMFMKLNPESILDE